MKLKDILTTVILLATIMIAGISTAGASPDVSLVADALNKTTSPGVNATYVLTVNNTGNAMDNYTLAISNPGGAVVGLSSNAVQNLAAGANTTVLLNVTNATIGTFRVNVTAISQGDTNKTASVNTTTGSAKLVFADSVINLNRGWNLVSIPSSADPSNVSTALQNVQFNAIFDFDPANTSFFTPTVLKPLYGYWINVTAENQSIGFIASTTIPSVPPERNLYEGWNLIGVSANHTDPINMTAGKLFAGLQNQQVGRFYSMLVSYEDLRKPEVFVGDGITNATELKQGHGYWLFINPIFNRPVNYVQWAGKPW